MYRFSLDQGTINISTLFTLTSIFIVLMLDSCNPAKNDNNKLMENAVEEFHADNDIAMTIRSLADALRVGEPLDSLDYDFTGILTDGEGAPLYTDIQGSPGQWVVDVIDTRNVSIKNLSLGDLLPDYLRSYILECLMIDENNRLSSFVNTVSDSNSDSEADISVYNLEGGVLRFEIRPGEAPNGLEGAFLTIILSSDYDSTDEIQKAA